MTTTLTAGQAKEIIDEAIANYDGSVGENTAETIATIVNSDLQLRDYVLGLPNEYDTTRCAMFVSSLAGQVKKHSRYALLTIGAFFEYELGEIETAKQLVEVSREINPDYNLTNLIKRVMQAGWSPELLVEMRKDLHPKVVKTITENADGKLGTI